MVYGVVHHELVEVAEVVADLVVGERRVAAEEADVLDGAAKRGQVALEDHRPRHVLEGVRGRRREVA